MEISIENFKAIKQLNNYEIKPLTIISGANSGGKSSLIQLLLMIKQTMENNISDQVLILNKPYVSLGKFKDIIYGGKVQNNYLSLEMIYDSKEIPPLIKKAQVLRKLDKGNLESITIKISFGYNSSASSIYVKEFYINWKLEKNYHLFLHLNKERGSKYSVVTNSPLFFRDHYFDFMRGSKKDNSVLDFLDGWKANIYFQKFLPYESSATSGDSTSEYQDEYFSPLATNFIDRLISGFFKNISYLGPLRDEPHSFYINDDDSNTKIGNKGEFAAHILEQKATNTVEYYKIRKKDNGTIEYFDDKDILEKAVNYWICEEFQMASLIKVHPIQSGMMYRIEVHNKDGLKIPINHVGFGISQILPIVVEGLISEKNSMLILEQPEIHLHPNVQSKLLDFLYSLILAGKRVIVETHSDHLITRLRRRIAESDDDSIVKTVNLTFVEKNEYNILKLTNSGTLEYWPEDFFDQIDKDIRAIVKAQTKKKISGKKV